MEIWGRAVDASTGTPLPGATVQRYYANGAVYSDAIVADANGLFNGRVPDNSYYWVVTNVSYKPTTAPLTQAVSSDTPQVTVRLERDADMLDPVTVTPGGLTTNKLAVYTAAAIAAVLAARYFKII